MMRIDKKDMLVYIVFLSFVLGFFARFLSGEQLFAFKDLSRYFYPLRYLMVEQVKAGQLPLWNPYIFCGWPLLATLQACFFYPLSLIYYLLPYNLAFNYYIIAHYFLAACFCYLLLRHFSLSKPSSFFGGMVFAFSGYLLSVSNMNTSLSSVIWLPLILLAFDRLIRQATFMNISGLGILLAVQFLGGEPTIIYVTLLFLLAYAAVFSSSFRTFGRALLGLLFGGGIALGLAAVQLLPFIELAALSDRVVRTSYELVTFRSFPPRELINFILPYFYGNPAQFGGFTDALIGRNFQDWLISPYIGILPLVLIAFAFGRRRKMAGFFALTAIVALWLAFGRYTPVYKLVYLLPGVSLIRYPVKYLFLTTFCLVMLSSLGFERLLEIVISNKEKLQGILRFNLLAWVLLLLGFLLGFALRQQIFNFLAAQYSAGLPKYFFELLASMIEFNLLSLFFVLMYLLGFIILLFFAARSMIKRSIFIILLLLLVIADLFANSSTIAVPVSAAVFEQIPPNYKILQAEKWLYRFFYSPELEKENRVILGEDYNDALLETKDNLTANWHIPYHFYDFYGYGSTKPYGLFTFYREAFKQDKLEKNLRLLSNYNVKYIATTKKLGNPFLQLLRHKKKYGLELYFYRNANALPRAYLLQGKKGPEWWWQKVKIVKYTPNEVVIKAHAPVKAELFLSDAYYPGWAAYVDGEKTEIKRARQYFRSVDLYPGDHEVRFRYEPLSFRVGAGISLLTVLMLIVGGIINFKKTR